MDYTPKILALSGSMRRDSYNRKVVRVAAEGAREAGGEVTFFNLKEYPLPIYDADLHEAEGFPENAVLFQKLLFEHNGLLISTPEYNGSLTGALKNALDWASRSNGDTEIGTAFRGKIAGIMSASPGNLGGICCLSHLREILTIMGVYVLPEEFAVSFVHEALNDNGFFKATKMQNSIWQHGANVVNLLKKLHLP